MSYGAILVFYACIIRLCHDFIKSKLKRVITYFIVSLISLFLIGATYNSKQINLSEKLIKDFSLTDDSILKTENQISKVLIPSDKHRLNKKLDNKIYNFLDSEIEKGIKSHNVKSIDSVVGELKYEKNDNQREKLKEKAEKGKNKILYYNLNERINAAENTKNESSLNDLLSSVESMNNSEEKSKLLNKINTIKDDIAKDKAEERISQNGYLKNIPAKNVTLEEFTNKDENRELNEGDIYKFEGRVTQFVLYLTSGAERKIRDMYNSLLPETKYFYSVILDKNISDTMIKSSYVYATRNDGDFLKKNEGKTMTFTVYIFKDKEGESYPVIINIE